MEHQEAVATLAAERYLLGDMTSTERESFEAHFFECGECAADLHAGAVMREGVRGGLVKNIPAVEPARRFSWRPAILIPWAAAASFALLAGYQTMRPGAGPAIGALGPVALAPVTLRPATRGEAPRVTPGPGGIVTLAVDLGGEAFDGGIQYELRRADGGAVSTGRLDAPGAGAPLLLIVPAGQLPRGEYVLMLRGGQNPGLTRSEYRFSVETP